MLPSVNIYNVQDFAKLIEHDMGHADAYVCGGVI
jgi:hypothetical protein